MIQHAALILLLATTAPQATHRAAADSCPCRKHVVTTARPKPSRFALVPAAAAATAPAPAAPASSRSPRAADPDPRPAAGPGFLARHPGWLLLGAVGAGILVARAGRSHDGDVTVIASGGNGGEGGDADESCGCWPPGHCRHRR